MDWSLCQSFLKIAICDKYLFTFVIIIFFYFEQYEESL